MSYGVPYTNGKPCPPGDDKPLPGVQTRDRGEGFYGHEWLEDYLVADFRDAANGLRQTADFLDGKADLLEQQMRAAIGDRSAKRQDRATGLGPKDESPGAL